MVVGEVETRCVRELWIPLAVDLCFHPKLIATAMELGIDEAHALGIVTRMWLFAFKYTKDGGLWRGDEDASHKFVAIATAYKGDVRQLVEVLRKERWLDDWLIHDWLDYTGPFWIKSFKTSRRSPASRIPVRTRNRRVTTRAFCILSKWADGQRV